MSVDYHVIPWPIGGTWHVFKRDARRSTRVLSSRVEAIETARQLAKKNPCGKVIVHRIDGTVSRITTYGKDPHTSRERARTKK
jgi:hypothetical protein